ncbi:MAG: hypothetical protein IPM98_20535 [Lewinellaceae bacterium]|nr:hypothetical protein [Lewinellaceae bacterium]
MLRLLVLLIVLLVSTCLTGQTTFKNDSGLLSQTGSGVWKVLRDNSFIIGGSTFGGGFGTDDAMLVKFSATGDVEWCRVFGSGGSDVFFHILSCPRAPTRCLRVSDGYVITGFTFSFGSGVPNVIAQKTRF